MISLVSVVITEAPNIVGADIVYDAQHVLRVFKLKIGKIINLSWTSKKTKLIQFLKMFFIFSMATRS